MTNKDRQDLIKKTTEMVDHVIEELNQLAYSLETNQITWKEFDKKKEIYGQLQSALYLEIQLLSELESIEDETTKKKDI